eukprot:206619_1
MEINEQSKNRPCLFVFHVSFCNLIIIPVSPAKLHAISSCFVVEHGPDKYIANCGKCIITEIPQKNGPGSPVPIHLLLLFISFDHFPSPFKPNSLTASAKNLLKKKYFEFRFFIFFLMFQNDFFYEMYY